MPRYMPLQYATGPQQLQDQFSFPLMPVSRLGDSLSAEFIFAEQGVFICMSHSLSHSIASIVNPIPSPTIMAFTLFTFAVALLAFLATPSSPASLIVATTALLGLSTGAAITYTLAHLLHLTAPPTHFVATSLITTFRGFAGSFGTAIGGGLFVRVLRRSLEQGFAEIGVRRPELIDELLRSPATVGGLKGLEAEVARAGYVEALRTVWFSAAAVAGTVIFVQAAAGWKGAAEIVQDGGEDEV